MSRRYPITHRPQVRVIRYKKDPGLVCPVDGCDWVPELPVCVAESLAEMFESAIGTGGKRYRGNPLHEEIKLREEWLADRIIEDHLETHTPRQWAATVNRLRRDLDDANRAVMWTMLSAGAP
jgi:hypothetical protein